MEQTLQRRVRFGDFELDPRAGELHKNGQSTVLQEQQLKILLMLIEREGEIVTREEIKKKLWPNDTVVEFDHSINNTIRNLRRLWTIRPTTPNTSRPCPARLSADGSGRVGWTAEDSSRKNPPPSRVKLQL